MQGILVVPGVHRGAGAAPRFTKPQGAGLSKGPGGGRRPAASFCGIVLGFLDESQDPDRCFRESRRHPRAPSKLSAKKQMPKVKGGKAFLHAFLHVDKFGVRLYDQFLKSESQKSFELQAGVGARFLALPEGSLI